MDPLWILALGIAVVVGGILLLRLHAFVALLAGALIVATLAPGAGLADAGARVAAELGSTAGQIAILIAMAAIIGRCLLESGAADCIVRAALRVFGDRLAPAAFMGSGFLLGVPVYFDTVFYLLIPLARSMGRRQPAQYGRYVMGIIAGGTMAHSLVPPTPGPLLVADKLGVDLGTMMIAGSVVGVFTCVFGYAYAAWINRLRPVPIRDSDQESPAQTHPQTASEARSSPPLGVSLAPIVLPVVLITGAAVLQAVAAESLPAWFAWLFATFGERNLALMLAAALALGILAHYRRASKSELGAIVSSALGSAGVIILITSAGGAFGGVLQDTGVSERIGALASDHQVALLPLAFFLTALIRTAQGSATVAMITTVGIVAGMTDTARLGFHPVYLAMAIGCGSKPFPWMNDSGFWIISRMSGMTEGETLRSFSCMITLMALAGLALVILAAKLWPLV